MSVVLVGFLSLEECLSSLLNGIERKVNVGKTQKVAAQGWVYVSVRALWKI